MSFTDSEEGFDPYAQFTTYSRDEWVDQNMEACGAMSVFVKKEKLESIYDSMLKSTDRHPAFVDRILLSELTWDSLGAKLKTPSFWEEHLDRLRLLNLYLFKWIQHLPETGGIELSLPRKAALYLLMSDSVSLELPKPDTILVQRFVTNSVPEYSSEVTRLAMVPRS